mmetsp:Transcript_16473/g.29970  ORF Transcript_16473/g.29970 Transcript_16473/m.29970 type:complete len:489 (-) Transcript_16473:114-1580(-)
MAAAAFQSNSAERRSTSAGSRPLNRDEITWSARGIDNHVKRPAGVSSAGMKRCGMKRIDIKSRQPTIEANFKMPDDCLTVSSCSDYGTRCVTSARKSPRINPANQHPAGIEASKTVQYNNHWMERDWKTSKESGGNPGRAPAWVYAFQTKRRIEPPENWDPIKHDFIRPRAWVPRSMRRMGYDNAANRETWNLMNSTNQSGPLEQNYTREQLRDIASKVHISSLNEIIYNIGGGEDLMPPATNDFVKADLPSSQQQQYENDCRNLSLFEQERCRNQYSRGGNPQLTESPDMYLCMHGCAENEVMGDIQEPPYPREANQGRTPSTQATRLSGQSPRAADFDTQSRRSRRSLQYSPSCDYYSDYFSERDPDYFSERGSRASIVSPMKPRTLQSARSGGRRSNLSEAESARQSDRGSRRSDTRRSYDDLRSIASSAFSERGSGMRRSKSMDRSPMTPMSEGGQSAGMFSNPRNTATATALREAMESRRSPY